MANVPLSLALEPVLPSRVPRAGGSTLGHGYRLRLPNGPVVEDDDPLLKAFGAAVDWLEHDDDEPLQLDVFDPGRSLCLTGEPFGHEACVLDAEGIRCAGTIGGDAGAIACAALEHGLPIEALALCEQREVADDRRWGLRLLVFSPTLVELHGRAATYRRPERPTRRRLVLFADAAGDLRWSVRWREDPDDGYENFRLAGRMRARARDLEERFRRHGLAISVQPVVVLWGNFEQRSLLSRSVAWVQGKELQRALRGRPTRLGTEAIERAASAMVDVMSSRSIGTLNRGPAYSRFARLRQP